MPFITEELWQKMRSYSRGRESLPEALIVAPWPTQRNYRDEGGAEYYFGKLQEAVTTVRTLRTSFNIPSTQELEVVLAVPGEQEREIFRAFQYAIERLARARLSIKTGFQKSRAYLSSASSHFEVFIKIEGVVDLEKEKARIEKKIEETEKYLRSICAKLDNPKFVENAPEELVVQERGKLLDLEALLKTHREQLALFEGG